MAEAVMDDETVEKLVCECLEALDEDPDKFNEWETDFLESIRDQNDWTYLTPKQIAKLEQLWEKKV